MFNSGQIFQMNKKLIDIILYSVLIAAFISGCRDGTAPSEPQELQNRAENETITFLAPTNTDRWKPGESYNIHWTGFTGAKNINLFLIKKKKYYPLDIAVNAVNAGMYRWDIPKDIPQSNYYQIKIVNSDDEQDYAYTEVFQIISY